SIYRQDERGRLEQAKVEGKIEGEKIGIEKGKIETAKKMKQKGFDPKTISDITGLTENEIEKLQKNGQLRSSIVIENARQVARYSCFMAFSFFFGSFFWLFEKEKSRSQERAKQKSSDCRDIFILTFILPIVSLYPYSTLILYG
ncbi:MAG TPA: hypothetical protein PLO89_11085, partial [Spirochaetota bacterium]|nr:hypothetical protein [Spirochaetota bacterium]